MLPFGIPMSTRQANGRLRFVGARLGAPAGQLAALRDFYAERLGLDAVLSADELCVTVGETRLCFEAVPDEPFYHFAFLLPGDRFEAAQRYARTRTELLEDPDSGHATFEFDFWSAHACYFADPAGNIVEFIAHRALEPTGRTEPFEACELLGISEIGLVGDTIEMATALNERLGLDLWDGPVDSPASLGFIGTKGRTLVLAPEGRGWLPTGRPAERHPVTVEIAGAGVGRVTLEDSLYEVVSRTA